MKKVLMLITLVLLSVVATVAQTTTLSYQAVVRNANNKVVQDSDIPLDVSITVGGTEMYFESRTAHTNHNGVVSFSIGGEGRTWPVTGHPTADLSSLTGWSNAVIDVTFHLTGGDITAHSPVSAVPYALEVANLATVATSGSYNDLSNKPNIHNGTLTITYGSETPVTFTANQEGNSAITIPAPAAQVNADWTATSGVEEILNKPDLSIYTTNAHLNDTLAHYPKVTALKDTAAAIRAAIPEDIAITTSDNSFSGTNTVPSGFNIETTTSSNCGDVVVNACDLLAVFDSLNRKINALEDALDALMHAIPPTITVALSDITSNSIKATATANDNGTAITAYEFCISTNSDMSSPSCYTATTPNYTFTSLDAYTTYYVTAKATNLAGSGTSDVVNARTPAHAPTGVLGSNLPPKPTGFQVTISNLDFKEPAEGTVQIFYKQGNDCSANDDDFTAWPVSGTLATGSNYTQNLTGLEPLTNYCVMVKVTNVDSTTTYGPVNTTSGEDISLIITPKFTNLGLCEGASVEDSLAVAPSLGDAADYSYEWSDGTNTFTGTPIAISFTTAGNKTITCTATHTTDNYTLTATTAITVTSLGTAPTFTAYENMLVVEVTTFSSDIVSINWGDGSEVLNNPQPWPQSWHAYAAPGGTYNIVATNASGCTATKTMSFGKAMLTPCSGSAHQGGIYAGQGHDNANDGHEYADENGIYAVTDYDGNVYPVVQIGSQCWLAENLRTTHSPETDALILLGADQTYGITNPSSRTSYTSKMAVWPSGSPSGTSVSIPNISNTTHINGTYSEIVPRFGLLYNWCAAVDTFKTGDPEVSNAQNTSVWNPVLNLENGNRRGICPQGWHLPSGAEYDAMAAAAGVEPRANNANPGSGAGKLATGCYWTSNSGTTAPGNYSYDERNARGFSAIPAGTFNDSQPRYYIGEIAYFWTTTQENANKGMRYRISNNWTGAKLDSNEKCHGASVRCVRDAE